MWKRPSDDEGTYKYIQQFLGGQVLVFIFVVEFVIANPLFFILGMSLLLRHFEVPYISRVVWLIHNSTMTNDFRNKICVGSSKWFYKQFLRFLWWMTFGRRCWQRCWGWFEEPSSEQSPKTASRSFWAGAAASWWNRQARRSWSCYKCPPCNPPVPGKKANTMCDKLPIKRCLSIFAHFKLSTHCKS